MLDSTIAPLAARYACTGPAPPASAAGLTHAASRPGPALLPNRLVASGGIVARNVAYAIEQCVSLDEPQSLTDAKSPPLVLPAGTCRRAPIRIAETSLSCS